MLRDKKKYSILVIEDNLGDFMLIEDQLDEKMLHPEIKHLRSFKAAEEFFSKEGEVDVILLDLSLPDKGGEALIREIVALAEDTPVIILTGFTDIDFSKFSISLGAADYLLKDDLSANTLYQSIIYNIERKKITLKLKESERKLLEQKIQENKTILKEVVAAQERERSELGKELHDNVNQILAAASLYLNHSLIQPDDYKTYVKKGQDYIGEAIEEIRKLTKALVGPSTEESISLVSTISDLVSDLAIVKNSNIEFNHFYFNEEELKDEVKLVLYRIIQEQLNNIFKYANASSIQIDLETSEEGVGLTIRDNGKGFDTSLKRKGIGLTNIKNRASLHNGTVQIISSPGNGCTLKVSLSTNTNLVSI